MHRIGGQVRQIQAALAQLDAESARLRKARSGRLRLVITGTAASVLVLAALAFFFRLF